MPANPRRRALRRPHRHHRPAVRRHPRPASRRSSSGSSARCSRARPKTRSTPLWRASDRRRRRRRRARAAVAPWSCEAPGGQVGRPRPRRGRRDEDLSRAGRDAPSAPVDCAVFLHRRTRPRRRRAARLAGRSTRPGRSACGRSSPPDSPVERLAAAFPEVTVNSIPLEPLGKRGRQLGLVLLPGLIPDVERLVVLPTPAVVTADVCELADLELGSHALAAPTRLGTAQHQRLRRHQHGREPAARPPGRRGRAAPRGAGPARVRLRRLQRGAAGARPRPAAPGAASWTRACGWPRTFRLNDVEILHFLIGPGPGARPRAVGRRADPHARARPRPAALGRRPEAVERRAHARARAVASPRRRRLGPPRPAAQLAEQRLPARADGVDPVARRRSRARRR